MLTVTDQQEIEIFMKAILGLSKICSYSCEKCGEGSDDYKYFDPHHVVYDPKPYVVKLCHKCHVHVTYMNRNKARMLGRSLENKDRWEVWREFLQADITEEMYERSAHIMRNWFN